MKSIGFLMSTKENEKRRAILPEHIRFIKNKNQLYFEEGYGYILGFSDTDYENEGAQVVSRSQVIKQDIICDPKIGDADYLVELNDGKVLFGWVHAVQNRNITNLIIEKKLTAIAWEDMHYCGRHVFWRNNELAGEVAVMHAFTLFGVSPNECNVALLGKGNTSRGAYKILTSLGSNVTIYDKKTEKLLREEIDKYNVVVNCVLWDVQRKDHILYKEDLSRLKKPAMIIDISCDKEGGIETSIPTTIENPIYVKEGVVHYAVDHTPSLVGYSVSRSIGSELIKYIDCLIEDKYEENEVLNKAIILKDGIIIDQRIKDYQRR